jgi:hypothetical protein
MAGLASALREVPEIEYAEEPTGDIVLSVVSNDDGSTDITIGEPPEEEAAEENTGWFDNLADKPGALLDTLAQHLLEGIAADVASRNDWTQNYTKGLDLLGLKIDEPSSTSKMMSTVRHPLLLQAIVKFQAGARGEMLPANGPVKVRNDGENNEDRNQRAQQLEDDLNHYLTVTATEYYPDTDRGLFYLGFGGTIFKKVYRCPLRQRPVSECVYAPNLIVSNDATDLANAERVTHEIEMSQQRMRELQATGVYTDAPLTQPISNPTPVEKKQGEVVGISAQPNRPEDAPHTVYECYTRLVPSMYGLPDNGIDDDSIAVPFRVTIEKDSKRILDIRRNWREDDPLRTPKKWFVQFNLIRGIGFLGLGFLHLVGNYTKALTAILRMSIDAGMYANFPGGIIAKLGRMETNEIQPGPGEWVPLETGGEDIHKAIMALPYKDVSAGLLALYDKMVQEGQGVAGTTFLETGDGRTNVPVGTIMAQIEQQTQVMTAVQKNLHQGQQEEFILLKELFSEDPEAISRGNPKAKRKWATAEEFDDLDLVPASDPNVPAQVHRLMQATAIQMLADSHPEEFKMNATLRRTLRTVGVGDIDDILAAPPDQAAAEGQAQGMGLEQIAMMQAALEAQKLKLQAAKIKADTMKVAGDLQMRAQEHADDMANAAADRASKERIAAMGDQTKLIEAGIAQAGQPASPDPVNDQAVGP